MTMIGDEPESANWQTSWPGWPNKPGKTAKCKPGKPGGKVSGQAPRRKKSLKQNRKRKI